MLELTIKVIYIMILSQFRDIFQFEETIMSWSKAKPNGFGGYRQEHTGRDHPESLHGQHVKGGRITGDHVHYHKDGMTVTKGGRKYTVSRRYCYTCEKETSQRSNDGSNWYCSVHERNRDAYPR